MLPAIEARHLHASRNVPDNHLISEVSQGLRIAWLLGVSMRALVIWFLVSHLL